MTTKFLPNTHQQSPVTLRTSVTYSDDIDLVIANTYPERFL